MKLCSGYIVLIVLSLLLQDEISAQSGNANYQYALIEAVKQKNIGNIPGAIELYKMVLGENDSVAVAHYELGTIYALTGNHEKAITHLERAIKLDPLNKWYLEGYVDVLVMAEDYKAAINQLKTRLKEEEQDAEHIFKLANIEFLAGKNRKAIRLLNEIEKEYGYSDRVSLLKANIYEQENRYEKALYEIEQIISFFPESIEFRVVAAELAMKNKEEDKAAEYYSEVYDLDSMNIYAITNLSDYYRKNKNYSKSFYYLEKSFHSNEIAYGKKMAILSYYLSDNEYLRKFNRELEALINTMLKNYPEEREIHLIGTDFFIENRNYGKALEALRPLLKSSEKKYELWKQGILLASATGQEDLMMELSQDAYGLFPDSIEIVYFKCIGEFEQRMYKDFLETVKKERSLLVSDFNIYSQIRSMEAEAHYRQDDYTRSDSIFRQIIAEEPENYLVMNNFSYYLSIRNESLAEAERLSYKTIEKEPENGTYLDTYAWILFKMGRIKEAEEYIIRALKFGGSNDPDVNEHAAEINRAMGSIAIARSFYQKAILLGGEKEKLIEKLKEIQNEGEF